jgi:Co/Zn/Cd efflux system component
MNRSVFHIPGMDCPSEERMIRLALEGKVQAQLAFDLPGRRMTVVHNEPAEHLLDLLVPLGVGVRLVETREFGADERADAAGASARSESATLWLVLAINATMFVVEVIAGWLAESTGLLADSLDMFADATVYGLSLYAVRRIAALQRRAAHLMGWLQLLLALGALAEVVRRFVFGGDPEPPVMISVALLALVANVTCLLLIAKHRGGGAHMKAAWICSNNDVLANLGVIVAGALVAWSGSRYPDLAIGSIIAALVLSGAIRILRLG